MRIEELYTTQAQPVSFEVFPPKGDLSLEAARGVAGELSKLHPSFISVTYSAGGSGNTRSTSDIAAMIQSELDTSSLAHLTCTGLTEQGLHDRIKQMQSVGIQNVLALRGDPCAGAPVGDFAYAKDIIPALVDAGFCVGAAAYPEGHVDCDNYEAGIEYLKQKQEAGASFFITQLFFDNEFFYRFREACDCTGIEVPISCGIMPLLSKKQVVRMAEPCGAAIPPALADLVSKYEDDPASLRAAGIDYACKQLEDLSHQGADGLHVYTMNKPDIAQAAMSALRL